MNRCGMKAGEEGVGAFWQSLRDWRSKLRVQIPANPPTSLHIFRPSLHDLPFLTPVHPNSLLAWTFHVEINSRDLFTGINPKDESTMDGGNADSLGVSSKEPPRTQFQSIEDFVKEHEELEAPKASQEKQKPQPQPKKKPKKEVDGETLATEARAVEELGDVNWVGRLLGWRSNPFWFGISNVLIAFQNTAMSIHQLMASLMWTAPSIPPASPDSRALWSSPKALINLAET